MVLNRALTCVDYFDLIFNENNVFFHEIHLLEGTESNKNCILNVSKHKVK